MPNKKDKPAVEFEYTDDETEEKDEEGEEIEADESDDEAEGEKIIEVIETVVNDEEIDDLIMRLKELKLTKESISVEIDDETELVLHHEDNLEEDEGEDEE